MRISDWSSDVCSSDLAPDLRAGERRRCAQHRVERAEVPGWRDVRRRRHRVGRREVRLFEEVAATVRRQEHDAEEDDQKHADARSEEHTSELQSLMRISYAVFCLKKKKKQKQIT